MKFRKLQKNKLTCSLVKNKTEHNWEEAEGGEIMRGGGGVGLALSMSFLCASDSNVTCFSSKLSGDADAAERGPHFGNRGPP